MWLIYNGRALQAMGEREKKKKEGNLHARLEKSYLTSNQGREGGDVMREMRL